MRPITRYTAMLALLLIAMSAAAQQTHHLTCKVMPDQLREAIIAGGSSVQTLLVYEATAEGKQGNIIGGFYVGQETQLDIPAGKQLIFSHPLGGVWAVDKWSANGQTLGGTEVEYSGRNKSGEYHNFYYETTYTMPDTDVEVEVWMVYNPTLPEDPGDGHYRLNIVSNAGDNMKFSYAYPYNLTVEHMTAWTDNGTYYCPAGEPVGIQVDCSDGWRLRRLELDGATLYEGDGMYGQEFEGHTNFHYYYIYTMPARDVTLYAYGEFRPDDPDHEGNNDLPRIPGSNGWDPATGEVTITNLVTYEDTYGHDMSSITDVMGALKDREGFKYEDIKSLVMACDMTPEGWSKASEQLQYLFTSTLPTNHLERIDLSRTWDWGNPGTHWVSGQYVPFTFKDGTPAGDGVVDRLFKAYNTTDVSSLKHLILPACVTGFVGTEPFENLGSLRALTLFSTTPPKVDDDTLDPLPLSLTLYVPGPSVPAYQADPCWGRFIDIRPIDESQVTDLTVYLPADYQDGRYADMTILLRNMASGETQQFVADDRSDYTFRSLPRGATYTVSLITPHDINLATVDSVYTYQRYVATGFNAITPLHNLTLSVRTDGVDVTDQCDIVWTTDDGSLIGNGSIMRWQPEGTTVAYDVKLPAFLANSFIQPPHATVSVGTIPDLIVVNAQRPTVTVVEGQVTDDSGRRVSGALVTFTLPINDNVSRTYTTVTDGSGNFSLEAATGAGVLAVTDTRYLKWSGNVTLPLTQDTKITLREITGPVVNYEMPYTRSVREGAQTDVVPAYDDMDNVDIEVYNLTTGQTLENISVQYPQIVLVEGAKAGDNLRLTASSRKGDFRPVETTMALDSEGKGNATLAVTALGGVFLQMEQTDNVAVTTNIYDTEGELYAAYAMSNADFTVDEMPDGAYTVVMMTTTELFGRMSRLAQYADLGLTEGTDYVKQAVTVRSGVIKTVNFPTVPVFDETRFYYIDAANTVFEANKSQVGLGNNFSLRASVTLRPEFAGRVTAAQLVVDLPSGTAIVPGSAMTGQRVVQFSQQDNRITIPVAVADLGQTTRFAVQTLGEGEKQSTAWLLLTIDGQQVRQPLTTVYVQVNGVGISVPEEVADLTVPVSGYAPALSRITVLADNIEIGHTMASADGFWNVDCQLPENTSNLSSFSVKVLMQTASGTTTYTEARDLIYDRDAIMALHTYMYCSDLRVINKNYVDFDYTTSTRKVEDVTLMLHIGSQYNWFFYTLLNTKDISRIKNVNLIVKFENGEIAILPSTYNPDRGMWYAETDMLIGSEEAQAWRANHTPVSVVVDVYTNDVEYKVDADLLRNTLNTLPTMQGCLQETMELIDNYFAQFATEKNPERLDQLLNEFNELFDIDPYMELAPEWQNLTTEQYLAKVRDLADNFSFGLDEFMEADMYDMHLEGVTIEHVGSINAVELIEEGYDELLTTDGNFLYLYQDEEKMIIIDGDMDMKITYDLNSEAAQANMMRVSGISRATMQENLEKMNSNFDKIKWLMELVQGACNVVVQGLKITENIKMCDNAIAIYENAIRTGTMAEEAAKHLARVTKNKAFWQGVENWLNTLKNEGPNVSTAFAAFTKGEGVIAKVAKVAMAGMKCIEKIMSWAALIADVTDGITKIKGLLDVYNSVPNPCKDDYANAVRIRDDIMRYGGWTSGLYLAVIVADAISMGQVNTGLTSAAAPPPGASLVMSAVGCALIITKTILMESYGKDYKRRIKNWEQEIFLLECDRKKPDFDPEHPYWKKRIEALNKYNQEMRVLHDPSGYVYEAVTDNRVKDATATIFYEGDVEDIYGDTHKEPISWDAENYGQVNPQITDVLGRYNWDTPQGLWQVKIEKAGYETAKSEWLPVPPPQLDVNIGIRQMAQPTVKKVVAYEDGLEVEFSKYMRPQTLHDGRVWLTREDKRIPIYIAPLNESTAWQSDSAYVSRWLLQSKTPLHTGEKVTLTVRREVESYAGVQMAADYQQEFVVTNRVREIATDPILEVPKGGTRTFRVVAEPASAAAGKQVVATMQHDMSATVTASAPFNSNGVATFTLNGIAGGSSDMTLALETDNEVNTHALVEVIDPDAMPVATPMASRISGTGVLPGDLLELWCDTEGATIWYTTDGTCPCDENGSRKEYSEPIVLNPPVTIRAYAVKGEQQESRVANFTYNLWTGITHIGDDMKAPAGYYDTQGRQIDSPQRGVSIVRTNDGKSHKIVRK